MGVNLRAENCQNECAPWQVAIYGARSVHTDDLSRSGIARTTRPVPLGARQDSDGGEGTDEQNVEDHEQDPRHFGVAAGAASDKEL